MQSNLMQIVFDEWHTVIRFLNWKTSITAHQRDTRLITNRFQIKIHQRAWTPASEKSITLLSFFKSLFFFVHRHFWETASSDHPKLPGNPLACGSFSLAWFTLKTKPCKLSKSLSKNMTQGPMGGRKGIRGKQEADDGPDTHPDPRGHDLINRLLNMTFLPVRFRCSTHSLPLLQK